jgi:hypothetical protein
VLRKSLVALIGATLAAVLSAAGVQPAEANLATTAPIPLSSGTSGESDWSSVDWSSVESGNCLIVKDRFGFRACDRGDAKGYWRVAFVGDSHMRQYFAPLDILAHKYHWQVKYISKSACTVANHLQFPEDLGSDSCRDWNRQLEEYFAKNKPFDLIVNSNSAFVSQNDPRMALAFRTTVQSQTNRGTQWLLISDNPKPTPDFQACIKANGAKAAQVCQIPYSKAMVPADILPKAVGSHPGVHVADFRKEFCPNNCPAVIKGVTVYRDFSHISSSFAKTLLPDLDASIPAVFKHKPRGKFWFAPELTVSQLISQL